MIVLQLFFMFSKYYNIFSTFTLIVIASQICNNYFRLILNSRFKNILSYLEIFLFCFKFYFLNDIIGIINV